MPIRSFYPSPWRVFFGVCRAIHVLTIAVLIAALIGEETWDILGSEAAGAIAGLLFLALLVATVGTFSDPTVGLDSANAVGVLVLADVVMGMWIIGLALVVHGWYGVVFLVTLFTWADDLSHWVSKEYQAQVSRN
jgi:hypothetical protein